MICDVKSEAIVDFCLEIVFSDRVLPADRVGQMVEFDKFE